MGKGAKEVFHVKKLMHVIWQNAYCRTYLIDVGDAMGANVTNTMCESVSPLIEKITGGRALLKNIVKLFY